MTLIFKHYPDIIRIYAHIRNELPAFKPSKVRVHKVTQTESITIPYRRALIKWNRPEELYRCAHRNSDISICVGDGGSQAMPCWGQCLSNIWFSKSVSGGGVEVSSHTMSSPMVNVCLISGLSKSVFCREWW